METRLKILLLTAGLMLGMSGCAALTVDVDVYKGPLANQTNVQIEQTTAMAIAAKPLLVQLRNGLEKIHIAKGLEKKNNLGIPDYEERKNRWGEYKKCTDRTKGAEDKFREVLIKNPHYVDDSTEYLFCDSDARSVNNILYLYNDRKKTGELGAIINEGKKLAAQYENYYDIFRPEALKRSQLRSEWKKNQAGMFPNIKNKAQEFKRAKQTSKSPSKTQTLTPSNKDISLDKANVLSVLIDALPNKTNDEKEEKKNLSKILLLHLASLANLFEDLQTRNPDAQLAHKKIIHNHRNLKKLLEKILNKTDADFNKASIKIFDRKLDSIVAQAKAGNTSSNYIFSALSQKSLVKAYAQLLFIAEDKKSKFIDRTIQIAETYLALRKTSEELLLWSLNFMIRANTTNTLGLKNYHFVNSELENLIPKLVNPQYLWGALILSEDEALKNNARVITKKLSAHIKNGGSWTYQDPESMRNMLRNLLKENPAEMALALQKTHIFYKRYPETVYKNLTESTKNHLKNIAKLSPSRGFNKARKFGIARGPGYNKSGLEKNLTESTRATNDNKNLPGYYAFIEPAFKKTITTALPNDTFDPIDEDPNLDRTEGSFSFLDKIIESLSKGINSGLANGRLDQGLETLIEDFLKTSFKASLPKSGRDCRADSCSEETIRKKREQLFKALVRFGEKIRTDANYQILFARTDSELNKYVRILQSVGNSIIFLIDDLEHKNNYLVDLKKNGPREWRALAINSTEYFNDVYKNMTSAMNSQVLALQVTINEIKALEAKKTSQEEKVTQHSAIHAFFTTNKTHIEGAISKAAITDSKDDVEKKVELELIANNKPLDDTKNKSITSAMGLIKSILTDDLLKKHKGAKNFKGSDIFNELDTQIEHLLRTLKSEVDKTKTALAAKIKSSSSKTQAEVKIAALKIAIKTLKEQKVAVAQDVAKNNQQFMPNEFKKNIAAKAKKTLIPNGKADPKDHNTIAYEAIESLLAQIKIPIPPAPEKTPNAKEVMDGLISTLKFEHIHLVKQFGRQSPVTLQAEAALKVAYDRRADMVRIRPAVSYLRTSFPSTTLQRDASTTSKNMLIRDSVKNIPILGELFHGDKEAREKEAVNRDIDKQFWQNINRIKLSGGGQTNYVLVKDDVGNWVIKSYSSDPTDVIKSAKNLALFSMGPQFTSGLTGQSGIADTASNAVTGQQADNLAQGQTTNEPEKPMTLMEKQFDTFQKEYNDQTKTDLTDIGNDVNNIQEDIEKRWEQDFSSAEEANTLESVKSVFASSSVKAYLDAAKKDNSSSMKPQEEILEKLKQILYMQKAIRSEIDNKIVDPVFKELMAGTKVQTDYQTAKGNSAKAIQSLNAAIKSFENKYIGRRKIASEKFDSAVRVTTTTINN